MSSRWPQVPGYTLLGHVGAGASGEVWRARREADQLMVALKVVRAADGDLATALREAALLTRVRHPHLLHLYDVIPLDDPVAGPGKAAGGISGAPRVALALQLAEGGSLAQVLAARQRLTPGEVVTLLSPVAAALAALHEAGVVHGDVSSGNVLFLSDGMPMLADVGVSRVVGEQTAALHGTEGLVAPEVLEGFDPGPESDVYALGALGWWGLTGQQPGWIGIRDELADLAPHVPQRLRDLVLRAMAPEPEDRPEAGEVAALVLELAEPEPIEVAPEADPGLGLTRRLRAAVRAENEQGSDPGEGVRTRLFGHRPARVAPRHRRSASSGRRAGSDGAAAGPTHPTHPLGAPAALVAGVAVLAVAVLVMALTRGSTQVPVGVLPQPVQPTLSATSPPPTSAGPTVLAPSSGADESPGSPGSFEVVQSLVDARARGWERGGDSDALAEGLARGSPAWRVDTTDLLAAADRGAVYDGVEFTVLRAVVRSPDGAPPQGLDGAEWSGVTTVQLSVTMRRAPLQIRTEGVVRTETTEEIQEVSLELRRTQDGWRIWSWA